MFSRVSSSHGTTTMHRRKSNENAPPSSLEPRVSRGYFIFPPGRDMSKGNFVDKGDPPSAAPTPPREGDTKQDRARDAGTQQEDQERSRRLKVEEDIASQGEWEWVR